MSDPSKALPTWEDALAAAVNDAQRIPVGHRLDDIKFGRYAERVGGGYWYELTIAYRYTNSTIDRCDDPSGRAGRIIRAWTEDRAKYEPTERNQP